MKTFKIGFVGAGHVTKMHLKGYSNHKDRVEVVAICDPNAEMVNERADEFDIPGRYSDVNEMISEGGIDVAIVCTPSPIRKNVLFPLIEAGIPVFVEKPFSDTLAEAQEIAEKANWHQVPVSVNQNFRRHHKFDFLRALVKENTIGKVEGIHFTSLFYRQDVGWRLQCERHAMSVMAIHWFDGLRRIADAEATSVFCQSYSSNAVNCLGETDATVQLQFENGIQVTFSQSFSSPFIKSDLIVFGDKGVLVTKSDTIELYQADPSGNANWNPSPVQTWNYSMGIEEATFDGLNQLLTWIETGEPASNSAEDNLKTVELLDAAYLSAKERRIVGLR